MKPKTQSHFKSNPPSLDNRERQGDRLLLSFKPRLLTALCLIPPVVAIVWLGNPWYTLLVAVAALLAGWEFYRMVAHSTERPLAYWGLLWIVLLLLSRSLDKFLPLSLVVTSAVILPFFWLVIRPGEGKVFYLWAWMMGGIFYVGWTISYFLPLGELDNGREWVLFTLFCTFALDSGAFLVGRALGKHLMAPHISPGKTWEGAAAGFLGALLASLVLVWLLKLPLGYASALLLGGLVGIFGQVGDLVESLLKRNLGVKDSGNLVPGHGGVLDRLDSLMFTVIVVYYYVIWLV